MQASHSFPYLVFTSADGEIGERRSLQALDFSGQALTLDELIPIPDGTTLSMLPRRRAVGQSRNGQRAVAGEQEWTLAALLPIGYTRTLLPAYEKTAESEDLPFFGYAAVAGWRGDLYVAAERTDNPERWLPRKFNSDQLERLVRKRLAADPENRVLRQHAHCALDYHCPTASNLFYERWEAAVAVSPGCNARCVGCISKQDADMPVSPQDRLLFVPSVDEIVAVGVKHLNSAPDAMLSFGQGCEGEPLLQARLIEQAIRIMRERTASGVININTNASSPRALQRLYDAGLDTLRASTISARTETYNAYYRPLGYTFEDVKRSLKLARDAGVFSSINLLCFPGLIDAEDEVEALLAFLRETGVRLVQLRNLNIDPEVLLPRLPQPQGKPMGIRNMIALLRREAPEVELGNFSRPMKRQMSATVEGEAPPEVRTTPVAP